MNIAIIGAGIAGLTTAIALDKKGIKTTVFETSPIIKELGAGLGLAANAIKAFEHLGLKDELLKICRPVNEFKILNDQGHEISKTKMVGNVTVHRAALQSFLLNQVDETSIYLNKKLASVINANDGVILQFLDGTHYNFDLLIVADGVHSLVRQKLIPNSHPRYAGYTCWRAVIDNSNLKINEFSETWGANGRFGIVPLNNNKLYWFACINATQNNPMMASFKVKDLLIQFKNYHNQIHEILLSTQDSDLIWSDIIDLKPIHQFAFNRIVLIGDAAHATTPNMGQGACQAIEDAVLLSQCMKANEDYKKAFKTFEQMRLKRVHWIVNTSWFIGRIAQLEKSWLIFLRNRFLNLVPDFINKAQQRKISRIEF